MKPGTSLALGILLGSALTVVASSASFAQSESPAIVLPNPDGRDQAFNSSRRGQSIEIEFSNPGGATLHQLADLPGRLRLINFWATWCVPCLRELPSLTELDSLYPDETLRVIAISMDRTEVAEVSEFVASLALRDLKWFTDQSRDAGKAANVIALPTSIVVDADGNELGRIVGSADWSSEEAIRLMDSLLADQPAD